jgi:hypothetical protein
MVLQKTGAALIKARLIILHSSIENNCLSDFFFMHRHRPFFMFNCRIAQLLFFVKVFFRNSTGIRCKRLHGAASGSAAWLGTKIFLLRFRSSVLGLNPEIFLALLRRIVTFLVSLF